LGGKFLHFCEIILERSLEKKRVFRMKDDQLMKVRYSRERVGQVCSVSFACSRRAMVLAL
jgi:hypothetical protein